MWIVYVGEGVDLRPETVNRIYVECEKRRGPGKRKWFVRVQDTFAHSDRILFTFPEEVLARECLLKIIQMIEERKEE